MEKFASLEVKNIKGYIPSIYELVDIHHLSSLKKEQNYIDEHSELSKSTTIRYEHDNSYKTSETETYWVTVCGVTTQKHRTISHTHYVTRDTLAIWRIKTPNEKIGRIKLKLI